MKRINRGGRRSATFKHSLLTAALAIAFSPPASASAYLWSAGNLSSSGVPSTLSMADVLTIGAGATKFVDTGLGNPATVHWNDSLFITGSNTISNSGSWIAGSNASLNGSASGSFINSGTFSTGPHTVAVSVSWQNSGTINTDAGGSIRFTGLSTSFTSGTRFTGDGRIYVANGASFNGAIRSDNLVLSSGTYTGNNAFISGVVDWKTGSLAGNWIVDYDGTLALQSGDTKYLNDTLSNLGTIAALDSFYLGNGGRLINRAFYDLQDDIAMTRSGSTGVFTNEGTLRKSGGGRTATVSGITFVNNGVINVQSGTFNFAGGTLLFNDGTRVTGGGQMAVTGNATFFGSLTAANNLTLSNGIFNGLDAALHGKANWASGTLAGVWEIAYPDTTLTLQPGNAKRLSGTLYNQGTIAAKDALYLRDGSTLVNGSLYDLQGDLAITNNESSGTFRNYGTLRKSSGNGSATVSGVTFDNNGEINVQSGAVNFASGTLLFNDGTRFTGGGQVAVTGNATFAGSITANDLTLGNSARFTGNNATLHGNAHWASGTLARNWSIAKGTTVTLPSGNAKNLDGMLINQGTIAAQDTLQLGFGSSLDNQSTYQLQGDVGIQGPWGGAVVNSGTLTKTAGNGTSSLSAIALLLNTGVIDVHTGTIALPSDFTNVGTLKGAGAYKTNLLINAGHVAPGATGSAPSRLALNGNYMQATTGSFDIGLQDPYHFGSLTVAGTATLDGVLAVSCVGACSFAVGTELLILASMGTRSGSFSSLVMNGFSSGAFKVVYKGNEVFLDVTQKTVAAVPENETWAMLLAGLGLTGIVARRRRA